MRKLLAIAIIICSTVFVVGANGRLHDRMMDHGFTSMGCEGGICAATHGIPITQVDCVAHCLGAAAASVPNVLVPLIIAATLLAAVFYHLRTAVSIFVATRGWTIAVQRRRLRQALVGVIMLN